MASTLSDCPRFNLRQVTFSEIRRLGSGIITLDGYVYHWLTYSNGLEEVVIVISNMFLLILAIRIYPFSGIWHLPDLVDLKLLIPVLQFISMDKYSGMGNVAKDIDHITASTR